MIALTSVYKTKGADKHLYEMLRERDGHVSISHRDMPTWAQHRRFVASKPYREWYLIVVSGEVVGQVYATKLNEIGVGVLSQFRRKGYASQAIAALLEKMDPLPAIPAQRWGQFLANINPKNAASIALFEGLGFRHVQNTFALGKPPRSISYGTLKAVMTVLGASKDEAAKQALAALQGEMRE